ncbi:MAG: hypothetical protein AAFW66_10430, partial [Pseudomonadota bacterium]
MPGLFHHIIGNRHRSIVVTSGACHEDPIALNKLREARPLPLLRANGAIDYAVNLVDFESRFRDVFAFVFGQTIIFESLERARPHIGRHRIVTLDGELLEMSGAMTGG